MYNKLKKIIDKHEIISFDIFDTLILRMYSKPSQVFYESMKNYNLLNDTKFDLYKYCDERINAENQARKLSNKEITLDDIFEKIDSKYDKNKLKEIEIEIEKEICFINPEMIEVLNYCYEKNKKVIIVSDMYLDKGIIEFILNNNAIKYDDLFLSSDYGVTKASGSLFKIVKEKYVSRKILHIGDNLKSDYINSKRNGLSSFKISKNVNDNDNLVFLNRFIQSKINKDNSYYNFGYKNIGPMMFGFSNFLVKNIRQEEKLYFLAREGKFIKECFELCNNYKSEYVYISRKSVLKYNIANYKSFDELLENISYAQDENVEQFLCRLSVDPNSVSEILNEYKINLSDYIKEKKIYDFFSENYMTLFKEQKNLFLEYMKQLKIDEKSVIVDIGWAGTMQNMIENTINKNIKGYYFGVREKNKNSRKIGYIYDNNKELEMLCRNFNGLFEIVMSADHGSTIGYIETDDGIKPVLMNNDLDENSLKNIIEIQNGAKQFIKDYSSFVYKLDLNKEEYFYNFFNVGIKPGISDIQLFKNIYVYDEKKYKLVDDFGTLYYITHLKQFIKDYKKSGWKSAFMKKNFKVYYLWFYKLLYNIDKKGGK